MFTTVFFAWFLPWLPLVFAGLITLTVAINTLLPNRKFLLFLKKISVIKLTYILVGATILYNIFLSILQYFTWNGAAFTRFFLPPYQPINYFLKYIFFHFWFASILTLVCSVAFYLFFKLVSKYRQDIISHKELPLIFLSSLLVAWPNFVILVPTFFILALIFSLINLLVFKKNNSSLTGPLISSLLIVFFAGWYLIKILSLSVLMI